MPVHIHSLKGTREEQNRVIGPFGERGLGWHSATTGSPKPSAQLKEELRYAFRRRLIGYTDSVGWLAAGCRLLIFTSIDALRITQVNAIPSTRNAFSVA